MLFRHANNCLRYSVTWLWSLFTVYWAVFWWINCALSFMDLWVLFSWYSACIKAGFAPQGHINQCGGHPWLHMFSRSTKDAFHPVSKISLIQCNIFMYYLDAHFIIHMLFVMNLTIGNNLIVQQLGNDMSTRVYLLFSIKILWTKNL